MKTAQFCVLAVATHLLHSLLKPRLQLLIHFLRLQGSGHEAFAGSEAWLCQWVKGTAHENAQVAYLPRPRTSNSSR
jgi:hypothetical protein